MVTNIDERIYASQTPKVSPSEQWQRETVRKIVSVQLNGPEKSTTYRDTSRPPQQKKDMFFRTELFVWSKKGGEFMFSCNFFLNIGGVKDAPDRWECKSYPTRWSTLSLVR